jgi:hypothetical protein|nr:MAG TPA: hypothetical protein [Caudoviricetes sp.]
MNNKINSNEYLTKYFNGTRLYPINLINYFKHYYNYDFCYQHNDNNFDESLDIILDYQDAYRLITSNIFQPLTIYKWNFSSATLNKIKSITNKYLTDKRIYIPGITPKSYFYPSRGNGKSIRELCYFIKLISDSEKNQFSSNLYSSEYTVQNYKSDMENLYKKIISEKILNSYETQNNSTKQRSNNKEEMSCLKIIADKNNINKKFHK